MAVTKPWLQWRNCCGAGGIHVKGPACCSGEGLLPGLWQLRLGPFTACKAHKGFVVSDSGLQLWQALHVQDKCAANFPSTVNYAPQQTMHAQQARLKRCTPQEGRPCGQIASE